ncbi:MAG: hypothetical protein WC789_10645 [Lentisphaeria bacterium]
MTLTEALAQTRRFAGLTPVDMATSDLSYFLAQAELEIARELVEVNPDMAADRDIVTIPGSSGPDHLFETSPANLPNLGSGRCVYKIREMFWLGSTTSGIRSRISMTSDPVELSGATVPVAKTPHTASSVRILFDGSKLRIYPPQSGGITLEIGYTRVPTAATGTTAPGNTILKDFPAGTSAHLADALVCMTAASAALGAWGRNNGWQEGRVAEMRDSLVLPLGLLQRAESSVNVGSRWVLDYRVV